MTTEALEALGATINFIQIWIKLLDHNYEVRYVVPQESRSILNPNGEEQRGIPHKNLRESPIPRKIQVGAKRKYF